MKQGHKAYGNEHWWQKKKRSRLNSSQYYYYFHFSVVFSRGHIQWNLPDDVRDGNAIRLVPFRRDRLTYDLDDDENEALGIFNALLIFTWPFIFGIFVFIMCWSSMGEMGAIFSPSSASSFWIFRFFRKIFRLHNPKMLCTTSWCANVVVYYFFFFIRVFDSPSVCMRVYVYCVLNKGDDDDQSDFSPGSHFIIFIWIQHP